MDAQTWGVDHWVVELESVANSICPVSVFDLKGVFAIPNQLSIGKYED